MKLFNIRRLSVLVMTSIILLHGVSPLLAIATTVESSTVESTTAESTTNSSDVEAQAPATEETSASEEQVTEPEYVEVETDYEQNELSSEYQEASAQPVVNLIKKQLTDGLTIEGEILAGIEQQDNRRTETHLTKLVLQYNESDDSWEDVHTFEIEGESAAVQAEKYAVNFSKSLDEIKAGNYRLIAEYDIQEYEEDNLKRVNQHKGMFVVGKVEEESNEENSSVSPEIDSPFKANKTFFEGSLYGGNALARSNPALNIHYYGEDANNFVDISEVSKHQALIKVKGKPLSDVSTYQGDIYIVWSKDQNYLKNILSPTSVSGGFLVNTININGWNTDVAPRGNFSKTTNAEMQVNHIRDVSITLVGLSPSTKYYFWLFRFEGGIPILGSPDRYVPFYPPGTAFPTGDNNFYTPYEFRTDDPIPLKIDPPRFDQANATTSSIKMLGQRYYGDIWGTSGTGKVHVSDNITIDSNKITGLGHDIVTGTTLNNTKYSDATITGLSPGTRYLGQVVLKNYVGQEINTLWADSQVFYTKNAPQPPNLVDATTTAPAKLTIRGNYGATSGINGAHPQSDADVDIRIKQDASETVTWNWANQQQVTSSTSGISIEGGIARNTNWANPNVEFKITGLLNYHPYWVAYRVKNPAGQWSEFASAKFTTKALPISKVDQPEIKYYGNNATKVELQQKTYQGGWARTLDGAYVEIYTVDNAGNYSQNYFRQTPLAHSGYGQSYADDRLDIVGLEPGRRYGLQIHMVDRNGQHHYSPVRDFYTRNEVDEPTITANERPPRVTFNAEYEALPGLTDAHPRDGLVDIEIKVSNQISPPNWDEVPALTTGTSGIRLESAPTFNRNAAQPNINFKIIGMTYNTNYWVTYRIRNKSRDYGQWSAYSTAKQFTTLAAPITGISTPVIEYQENVANKVKLKQGTYSGGLVRTNSAWAELYRPGNNPPNNWGSWFDRVALPYSINTNPNTYATGGIDLTTLDPGTKYGVQIHLMDNTTNNDDGTGGSPHKFSTPVSFYTPNTVSQPDPVVTTTPDSNGPGARITAGYQAEANVDGVDPSNSWNNVRVKLGNSNVLADAWELSTIQTPSTNGLLSGTPQVNTATKKVTFNLTHMNPNTNYWVFYSVKNSSGQWSDWSIPRGFKTKAYLINTVNTPEVSHITNSATSVKLKENGFSGAYAASGVVDIATVRNLGPTIVGSPVAIANISNNPYKYAVGDQQLDNLKVGTKYALKVRLKNVDGVEEPSAWGYFATKNEVNPVTNVSYTTPTTNTNAQASMHGVYKVSDHVEERAHPKVSGVSDGYDGQKGVDIQLISTQDPNYSSWKSIKSVASSDSPAVVSSLVINATNTTNQVEFTLGKLRANTTYKVRYRVKNDSNEWSAYSTDSTITTLARTSGYYFSNVPEFDFGAQSAQSTLLEAGLSQSNGTDDFAMLVENIGVASKWKLTAQLTELETTDGSNLNLAGAQLRMSKLLEKTTDDINWTTVTTDFTGLGTNTVILTAGNSAEHLFEATTISAGQGTFRNRIDFDSVKLIIPGNAAQNDKTYKGKVIWTIDNVL